MGLPDPKKRKPTASEVAAWARSRIGKRLDVDGYYGASVKSSTFNEQSL